MLNHYAVLKLLLREWFVLHHNRLKHHWSWNHRESNLHSSQSGALALWYEILLLTLLVPTTWSTPFPIALRLATWFMHNLNLHLINWIVRHLLRIHLLRYFTGIVLRKQLKRALGQQWATLSNGIRVYQGNSTQLIQTGLEFPASRIVGLVPGIRFLKVKIWFLIWLLNDNGIHGMRLLPDSALAMTAFLWKRFHWLSSALASTSSIVVHKLIDYFCLLELTKRSFREYW